jgi:hypothetical protein
MDIRKLNNMIKSLLIRDLDSLNKQLVSPVNYLDLDYNALSPDPGSTQGKTHTRTRILHGDYAVLNAFRMWLQSRKYDYIRAPTFGGMFDSALNDRFPLKKESESDVSSFIKSESAAHWPQIEVLEVNVTAEVEKKSWLIRIVARDKNSGMVLADEISRTTN